MISKKTGLLLATLCILGGQTADAKTVKMKIIKDADAPTGKYSYVVITNKEHSLHGIENRKDQEILGSKISTMTHFTKNSTTSFDDGNKDIRISLFLPSNKNKVTVLKGTNSEDNFAHLPAGAQNNLGAYEIRINKNGDLRLAEKIGATRKMSVVRREPSKNKWTITASSIKDQAQIYGTVSIKEKTNPGFGLAIPVDKDFDITVSGIGVTRKGPQMITKAEVPSTVTTMYIKADGVVTLH